MFCYPCEQTSRGTGCVKVGICGKSPEVADLQDVLMYATSGWRSRSPPCRRRAAGGDRAAA